MTTQVTLAPDVAEKVDEWAADSGQAADELVNAILRRDLRNVTAQPTNTLDAQDESSRSLAELFAGRIGRVRGTSEPMAAQASKRYAELLEEEYRLREGTPRPLSTAAQ